MVYMHKLHIKETANINQQDEVRRSRNSLNQQYHSQQNFKAPQRGLIPDYLNLHLDKDDPLFATNSQQSEYNDNYLNFVKSNLDQSLLIEMKSISTN